LILAFQVPELSTDAATLPASGFIPARIGSTASYQYDATESGTSGNISIHTSLTISRTSADKLSVALKTADGKSAEREALIGDDGSLQPFAPRSLGTPSPSPTPTQAPRHRPIPTITESPRPKARHEPPAIPEPVLEVAAMLAAAETEGTYPRTWRHALDSSSVPFVLSLSRNENGPVSVFTADGGGSGNAIHVEAAVRDGRFVNARGTLQVVTSNMDQTATSTTTWSITPVSGT
jgi:hypothetical protein